METSKLTCPEMLKVIQDCIVIYKHSFDNAPKGLKKCLEIEKYFIDKCNKDTTTITHVK